MPRKKYSAASRTPAKSGELIDTSPLREGDIASDLMVGAEAIGEFIGRPEREVYYLASVGRLPVFRWGAKLAARRSTIRTHIMELEKAATR